MEKSNLLTKILATAGTVLVWSPILAPLLFSLLHWARARRFMLDYLMPAELFLAVIAGGALLIWAAVRARSRRALIGIALGAAVILLFVGQAIAVATGLASGATEPAGLPWAAVVASLVLYDAAVAAVGIGGALLLRDLFRSSNQIRITTR